MTDPEKEEYTKRFQAAISKLKSNPIQYPILNEQERKIKQGKKKEFWDALEEAVEQQMGLKEEP